MPYATLPTGSMFYARHGSHGPSVILIHGAGESHLVWPPELRRLGGATVFAIDLPGHGKSSGAGETTVAAYADNLRAFMTAVGVERAILVGHSMGGAIAQTLALMHPENVQALALVGTGARLRVAPALLDGVRSDFSAVVALIADWAHGSGTDDRIRALSTRLMSRVDPNVMYGDFLACDAFDIMDRLGEVAAPTLVICGTEDRMSPLKYSNKLASDIPNASLVTVEGAGHMVMLENPQAVSEALSAFIRERVV